MWTARCARPQAVPGFYYREYSRSLVGDDERLSAAKSPEWRLRFRPADVAAWHAAMGDWLKTNDPWRHLVTTSLTGGSDRPEIWQLPQMDFAM